MKRISFWLPVLLLVSCQPEAEETNSTLAVNTTNVNVIQVDESIFAHYFEVHGTVQSEQNVLINTELPGLISSIKVKVGDEVSKGQTLAVIDQSVISSTIQEVQTALELALDVYQRQQNLWDQGIGSEMQLLQAENNVKQLEDRLNTLNAQRSMSIISAPFAGIIDEVFAKEGEMATGQFPVLRLVNLDKIYIEADVSERYLRGVKQGMEVNVNFASINEQTTAVITHVGQYINPANRTFKIRIDMENPEGYLKPNLLSYVSIMDEVDSTALVVPTNLISDRGTAPYVFVVEYQDSLTIARKTPVEEGFSYNNESSVISGLTVGQKVVVDHLIVEDGTRITTRMTER